MSKDDFYEEFWSDQAYHEAYALDSALRDRIPAIEYLWTGLEKPASLLDFGCGNGVLTYWLTKFGYGCRVVGIDVSLSAIKQARNQYSAEGLSFLHISEGIPDEHYDMVVSSHVLEHVEDPVAALNELRNFGECFVLEVPLEDCLWANFRARLTKRHRADNPLGHLHFWTRNSFTTLLSNCGFHVVKEYHYASAPFSPFTKKYKAALERLFLKILGLRIYSFFFATHFAVLAWPKGSHRRRVT